MTSNSLCQCHRSFLFWVKKVFFRAFQRPYGLWVALERPFTICTSTKIESCHRFSVSFYLGGNSGQIVVPASYFLSLSIWKWWVNICGAKLVQGNWDCGKWKCEFLHLGSWGGQYNVKQAFLISFSR